MSTNSLLAPIQQELQLVEIQLRESVRIEFAPLMDVFELLIGSGGKRFRPALAILASKFRPADQAKVITLAVATELTHAATLIHDDLIDKSPVRRGSPTINSRWSGTATVLAGDFLLARAADIAASIDDLRVMKIFARTLMVICEGEIRQDFAGANWPPNRTEYYRHIESKTASLFAAATEGGAILSHSTEAEIAAMRAFGLNFGLAFQIADDILDFTADQSNLGKPVGSDLRQGTYTLPVFYYLEQNGNGAQTAEMIKNNIDDFVQAIRTSPAIDASKAEALQFVNRAKDALAIFPDGQYRRTMSDLADYVIERSL